MCKKSALFGHKKLKMTKLLMISLMFRRLKGTVFSRLLKKAISMALWTKAITCDKANFKSRFCQVHQAGKIRSLPTFKVDPRNLRNPRLINDLRLRKITYEKINLFLQNEPNFRKSQVNVSEVLVVDYGKMDTWLGRKNEPKTNPNEPEQTRFLRCFVGQDCEKRGDDFENYNL